MDLIFYNPHIHDFLGEPLQFTLLNRKALRKYDFLFKNQVENKKDILIYLDDTYSVIFNSFIFLHFPVFLRKWIVKFEFYHWKKNSGYEGKIKIIDNSEIKKEHILFLFSHKITFDQFDKRKKNIDQFNAKIIHLSHYFLGTSSKSENIRKLSNVWLAGDSDIIENTYFKKYFHWYTRKMLIVPFGISDRFIKKNKTAISPKILATGTFHDLYTEKPSWIYYDFLSFFKSSTYHPMRKEIFYKKETIQDTIHCKISLFNKKGFFFKINISQKKYFDFDIVDEYNSYKFAIVPEELAGFPAIGFFEAMACGCILFGQSTYYKGTGLFPNVHYIEYDGTIKDLLRRYHEVKSDSKLLERIVNSSSKQIEIFKYLYKQSLEMIHE